MWIRIHIKIITYMLFCKYNLKLIEAAERIEKIKIII